MAEAKKNRKKKIAVITTALVAISGGAAFAYWTTTGTGTGSATTGSVTGVTINQTALTAPPLAPGVAAKTLSGTFTNTNGGPAYVTSVTASIGSVTKATGVTGTCDATDYTLTGATMTVGADVPAGSGVGAWTGATIAFNNKTTNQDACKGATVNLTYTSN